jgi:transcriptional regulator with GAF, ATPase, and Fis domain
VAVSVRIAERFFEALAPLVDGQAGWMTLATAEGCEQVPWRAAGAGPCAAGGGWPATLERQDAAPPRDPEWVHPTLLRVPIDAGPDGHGMAWLFTRRPAATPAEAGAGLEAARRLAALAALALGEQARAGRPAADIERLAALDDILPALASVLDVREVFRQISAICQRVLPHDVLGLVLFDGDPAQLRIYAFAGPDDFTPPERLALPVAVPGPDGAMRSPVEILERWQFLIQHDAEAPGQREWDPIRRYGLRSALRVPLRLGDELAGGVGFMSYEPFRFSENDVALARRVANYITLALAHQRLADEAARAAEARERAARLEQRVRSLTSELETLGGYRRIVGRSAPWMAMLTEVAKVAPTEATVLLLGESGTGKEVVARLIHRASPRSGGPFVAINCAALPESLLESELFGFERGAFTGAHQARPGRLEQAAGGVLFLDEVAEMSLAVQAKLLRVLENREFQRLGATRPRRADIRVIAATNRDLRRLVERGLFREDLYYRLNVFAIRLPPLRERGDDILLLSEAFLEEISRVIGRPPAGLSRDARPRLLAYAWPGNVRELHNVLERAAILSDGGLITAAHLAIPDAGELHPGAREAPRVEGARAAEAEPRGAPARTSRASFEGSPPAGRGPAAPAILSDLHAAERAAIERALVEARYNKSRAARRLGISRAQLYVRLRRHGLG